MLAAIRRFSKCNERVKMGILAGPGSKRGHVVPSSRLDPPLPVLLAAALIFTLALWLRLAGLAWDGWANLHPDERHMIFVTQDLQRSLAAALAEGRGLWSIWFGPDPVLDPRAEGRLYVYGDLPILVLVWVSHGLGITDWGGTVWLGRSLTALVEASAVLAVFILSRQLRLPARAGLAAAALLALAPLPLQLALFFTVDAWLAALCLWVLVALVALAQGGAAGAALAAGVLAGLAAACKVSAVALALPMLVAAALVWQKRGPRAALRGLALCLVAGLVVYRIANPSAFAGGGFLDLRLSPAMIADFRALPAILTSPDSPANWQWLLPYPITAFLRDMILFGTGPVLALFGFAGLLHRPRGGEWVIVAGFAAFLLLSALSEVRVMRYAAPLVPVVAVLAIAPLARLRPALLVLVLALAGWWAGGSLRLHDGQHPRLIATEWMRALPPGTAIGFETDWDEALPVLQTPPGVDWRPQPGPFTAVSLRLTDPETPDTPARLAEALAQVDYLAISSGRQIEVMPRLPDRFPTVARYYHALLANELCFERVLHLDRGFPLPLLRLDDRFAQESWRVYDHPIVQIWQKQPCFDRNRAEDVLSGGQDPAR